MHRRSERRRGSGDQRAARTGRIGAARCQDRVGAVGFLRWCAQARRIDAWTAGRVFRFDELGGLKDFSSNTFEFKQN